MKALQTQFDDKRLSNAVATPTCSSCCCCCCCLATSIASSTLLAQRVAKEGEKHQVFNRHLLTVLAALFVPIVGGLVYIGFWTISSLLKTCTEYSAQYYGSANNDSYTVCTNASVAWIIPLLITTVFLVLLYLYARVRIKNPVQRATLVTTLIVIAFTIEFFGGAILILTGVGGIVYLILIPIVVGWITVWYHRHIGKEVTDPSIHPMQPAYPIEQSMEHNDQTPPNPDQPSQPNPPTASAQ